MYLRFLNLNVDEMLVALVRSLATRFPNKPGVSHVLG